MRGARGSLLSHCMVSCRSKQHRLCPCPLCDGKQHRCESRQRDAGEWDPLRQPLHAGQRNPDVRERHLQLQPVLLRVSHNPRGCAASDGEDWPLSEAFCSPCKDGTTEALSDLRPRYIERDLSEDIKVVSMFSNIPVTAPGVASFSLPDGR